MIFDYEQMRQFKEWVGKHPVLGTLAIIGSIVFLIALCYIGKRLDEWELMRKYKRKC